MIGLTHRKYVIAACISLFSHIVQAETQVFTDRTAFLASLQNVTEESFESLVATNIANQAVLDANGFSVSSTPNQLGIFDFRTGGDTYATNGIKYLVIANPDQPVVATFVFDVPIFAVGFDITDYEGGKALPLTFTYDGGTVVASNTAENGVQEFFGIIDTSHSFTQFTLSNPSQTGDGFGIDFVASTATSTMAQCAGPLIVWGDNGYGQLNVPSGTFTTMDAGDRHGLAIRSDGTLAGWGDNNSGQSTVPGGTFTAVAAGDHHSLAIRTDGTLSGWGLNGDGQTTIPSGTFTAVKAGGEFSIAIRTNGTLAGWGLNNVGQINVPSGTFTSASAGSAHGLAIRSDGTLAGWGYNATGQIDVPSGTFVAVAGGGNHSLAIRSNGALVGWGDNSYGQIDVPSGTFIAIAGGYYYSLAIRSNGTLVGWGRNDFGQSTVPSGTFMAVAAGDYHGLAFRSDADSDCVPDVSDNCPTIANSNQSNLDGDSLGDACDQCPFDPTNTKTPEGQCIPTVSQWGIVVMALLVLTAGTIVVRRRGLNAA